jgi:hypothetical protein
MFKHLPSVILGPLLLQLNKPTMNTKELNVKPQETNVEKQ